MRNHASSTKQDCNHSSFTLQRKPTLHIGEKDHVYEQEADRTADAVMNGAAHRRSWSLSKINISPPLQRQQKSKPKSEEEKYKEAAKKLGEAFLETGPGKEIKEKAEKLGDAFISTLPGKIIAGSAISGAVAALAATHKELPIGIPEIPLDKIKPGLKLKITYEGPVDKPTKIMVGFSIPLAESKKSKKPAVTKSQQFRAETARMAMEQHQFRESMKTPAQKAEEQNMINAWILYGATGSPLSLGTAGIGSGQTTTPSLSGKAPPPPLAPFASEFKINGEQPKREEPKKKKEETPVQRKPNGTVQKSGVPAIVYETLQDPGHSLDENTRIFMESRFGYDFSQVRIHTNARAGQSARAINASAYTVGSKLVFADGNYSPYSPQGQHLLAHELAHVIQQRASTQPPKGGLQLDTGAGALEYEADDAAYGALHGKKVSSGSFSQLRSVQRIQRAEHGTYVSKLGEKDYLDAGARFYKTWGHPNVKRVSNMDDVLTDLDRGKGPIDKFRIVSHGSSTGLELGLLPQLSPEEFGADAAKFTTQKRFRKQFAKMKLVSESFFKRIYRLLQTDTKTRALLTVLGAGKRTPAATSALGIVLRAIVDQRFLADVKLPSGKRPRIAHRAQLNAFVNQRLSLYRKIVVNTGTAKIERKKRTKAIAELIKHLPAVLASNTITFTPMEQQVADSLADPFLEGAGKQKRLRRDLTKSVREGADGPYLRKLRRVKNKISDKTHIEIRGCNVGRKPALLDTYRGYFGRSGNLPSISAPDLYQYFFRLSFQTYLKNSTEDAKLEAAFAEPSTGLARGFEDLKRMQAGEMTRVVNEKKMTDLAIKYGFNAAKVRKLNPEIKNPNKLKPGDVVWLVQRRTVNAGIYRTLSDFCKGYLGNQYTWPKVWGANPTIKNPSKLKPNQVLQLPAAVLTPPVATAAPTVQEFTAAVRSGKLVAGLSTEHNKPIVHMDNSKRAKALAEWLVAQKFDPKGRTAVALSKHYKKRFRKAAERTYIGLLSRSYPTIVDPIFPEDPRHDKHIIRRP